MKKYAILKFKKLIGNRLYLTPRGSSLGETLKYTEWLNDPRVSDFLGRTSMAISYEEEKEHLENALKNPNERSFNITDSKTNKIIGTISLERIEWVGKSAELGILIGDEEFRSKGYGTEAIRIILDYAFNFLNLNCIYLALISSNKRAYKCYLKCGFKDSGRIRDRIFINGQYYDMLFMDILSSEFSGDYIMNKEINA